MKAAVLTHYDKKGTDLEIQDLPVPVPEDDEILAFGIEATWNFWTYINIEIVVAYVSIIN